MFVNFTIFFFVTYYFDSRNRHKGTIDDRQGFIGDPNALDEKKKSFWWLLSLQFLMFTIQCWRWGCANL